MNLDHWRCGNTLRRLPTFPTLQCNTNFYTKMYNYKRSNTKVEIQNRYIYKALLRVVGSTKLLTKLAEFKTQSNYYKYKDMKKKYQKKYKYGMWLYHSEQNWSRPKHGHKVFADHIKLHLSSPDF